MAIDVVTARDANGSSFAEDQYPNANSIGVREGGHLAVLKPIQGSNTGKTVALPAPGAWFSASESSEK